MIDVRIGDHCQHRRLDIADREFVLRVVFPQRFQVVMRPHRAAQQADGARMRKACRRLLVMRPAFALEARRGAGIDIGSELRSSGRRLQHAGHRLGRDLRVVFREVHDKRAADARHQVEPEIDPEAVIGNRAIDRRLGGGKPGELAAEAEAERTDFADALAAGAQRRDRGADLLGPVQRREGLGAEHDIAFAGVKIAEFVQPPAVVVDVRKKNQPRPRAALGNGEMGAAGCEIDKFLLHISPPLLIAGHSIGTAA